MIFSINIIILCVILIALGVAEYFLAKKGIIFGLIIPIFSVVSALVIDKILFISTFVYTVVFVLTIIRQKDKEKQQKELDKMNIQDL